MKAFLLYTSFLISALSFGQKPVVLLEVDPKEAKLGEVLTITVKSNVQGEIDIELPSGFVHGYNVMNGMEQEMDYNTGKVISFFYMSQTGAMNKEGTFTFGPAYIKKGSRVYRSNTVTVTIKKESTPSVDSDEITSKQLKQPAFGVIECSRKSVYEGEPVVLSAKVYSHFNPTHLEDYQPYAMDGVIEKHEIGNNQRILIEETSVKGIRLYYFAYDKNVLFPTGTGQVTVEPFKLLLRKGFETVPITSSSRAVEVKPLPKAPRDFAGGVGEFSINRSLSGTSFKQGEVFTMTLTINGVGNLHNLMEPVLQLPKGFVVYGDPMVKENFSFTARGVEGSISYEYHIQITRYGDLSLPGTSFSYFDPKKERYVSIQTDHTKLKVEKNANFKPDPGNKGTTQVAQLPDTGTMRAESERDLPFDPFDGNAMLFSVGAPLLALLFGFITRKRSALKAAHDKGEPDRLLWDTIDRSILDAKMAYKAGNKETCGALIEKAVLTYLSSFPDAEHLTRSELLQRIEHPNEAQFIREILNSCEMARYGMGAEVINDELIVKTTSVFQNLKG